MTNFIEFTLTHNYFSYLGDSYRQVRGTAMGARFAPSYANLFMGFWEDQCIWANNPFAANLALYVRYIDDVQIIWNRSEMELQNFLKYCNANSFGKAFTHVVDDNSLVFLDLELNVHHEGNIFSKIHFKPSAWKFIFTCQESSPPKMDI